MFPNSKHRMSFDLHLKEQKALALYCLKWCALGTWVGVLSGTASAAFLAALGWATNTRVQHPLLLWGLPLAGAATGWVYSRYGKSVEGGNNLVLDTIHDPKQAIPFRMAPLILVSTVATHLFGGSAGREGTAVQMGGTLATASVGPLRLSRLDHRVLIMAGVAGGFGSVFGTPIAGMVFGMEVLAVGRMQYDGLLPCLVASFVGDLVCRKLGIQHHLYSVSTVPDLESITLPLVVLAGVFFALASQMFIEATAYVHRTVNKWIPMPWLRTAAGGLAVALLGTILGSEYLGLSLPLIERSFDVQSQAPWVFAVKILLTAITLGCGFKGGEVTPLFCIGATLGSAFAGITHQPTSFFAGLGFVAVFAGAANTPLACAIMGIELFGAKMAVPLAITCSISYILSGHRGIYLSQRISTRKGESADGEKMQTLRQNRTGIVASENVVLEVGGFVISEDPSEEKS